MFEKLFLIAFGAILATLYDLKKNRLIDIDKKLFEISNNLIELKHLFHECDHFCDRGEYDQYYEHRKLFFKLYDKTYHLLYFYYYELDKPFISTLTYVIKQLKNMEKIYRTRQKKDDYNIKRDTLKEWMYENQYLDDIDKHFKQLHELIKYKKDHPFKKINFASLRTSDICEYHN